MKEVLESKTNNMEKSTTAEKEISNMEQVDLGEMAAKALAADVESKALATDDKLQVDKGLNEVRDDINKIAKPEADKKEALAGASEAQLAKRKEFASKAIQMMIDNLQKNLDKKGVGAWFNKVTGTKKEMEDALKQLKGLKGQNRPGVYLEGQFAYPSAGRFTDEDVKKELLSMVSAELDPEDQKTFLGNDKVRAQVGHKLTDVSAG